MRMNKIIPVFFLVLRKVLAEVRELFCLSKRGEKKDVMLIEQRTVQTFNCTSHCTENLRHETFLS